MTTAVVVGSGPNGLAAAIRLAQAGVRVTVLEQAATLGGAVRHTEYAVPSVRHDVGATAMPMAAASSFFRSLELERHGLTWIHHEAVLAHPLDDAPAAMLWRDVERTVDDLGDAGWRRVFEPLIRHPEALFDAALAPIARVPRHPIVLTRLGLRAALPATLLARGLHTERGRALFSGIAAHAFNRLEAPFSSGPGIVLGAAAHVYGWPIPRGGAGALTAALAAELQSLGGTIELGRPVTRVRELDADIVLLSVPPGLASTMLDVPGPVRRAWRRFRPGPAAFKLDVTIDDDVPWHDPACSTAGVLHLGGTIDEIATAEAQAVRGVMPERPFVLAAQPHAADPTRSSGALRPLWLYAHVPHAWTGDATEAILAQVERFAPGFRDVVRDVHATPPAELERLDPALLGGDIGGGANTARQLVFRPRLGDSGYRTGVPGVYLCGSSTSPGGGVHGMAGFHAAEAALTDLRRGRA